MRAMLVAVMCVAVPVTMPTRTVVVSVQDPQGRLIPNLRPENFAVYENGVRQRDVTADVAHAAITLSVLLEGGGRYQTINKILATEIPYLVRPLADALVPDDKVGVFAYTETLRTLGDFPQAHTALDSLITGIPAPGFSEAKLFDALVVLFDRLQRLGGRKAVLLISTGIDTFSHAKFEDAIAAAQRAATPVYVISLAGLVERTSIGSTGPITKIDWARTKERMQSLAQRSGGRAYSRDTEIEVPAVYDDMMENLRVRYVLTYPRSNLDPGTAAIRVELIEPKTGAPLRVADAAGKSITPTVKISHDGSAGQ
jgi:Ca-activated chloride channel family protein